MKPKRTSAGMEMNFGESVKAIMESYQCLYSKAGSKPKAGNRTNNQLVRETPGGGADRRA